MKNSDDIFKAHLVEAGRNYPWENKPPEGKERKFFFSILIVLFFAGAEIVYIIFRKNFGRQGIKIPKLIVAIVCFALISWGLLDQYFNPDNVSDNDGDLPSYLVSGLLLVLITVTVIVRAIFLYNNATNDSEFRGESYLLGFLAKDGWKQQTIQAVAEPLLVLVSGTALCFYNLYAGLTIAFCGLSVWGTMLLELFYLGNRVQSAINTQSLNPNNDISKVS